MEPRPIMDPDPFGGRYVAPPPFGSAAALELPGDEAFLPPPYYDERLVEPETREEMVRGHRFYAAPAKPEHGDRHLEVDRVIGSHVAPGYIASSDLLTRAGPYSDFATDTCVRRAGIDPRTGSRYLEELAFEVVNTQSLRHMTLRAEDLTSCGVRRLLGIFVKKGEIQEWSSTEGRWVPLDLEGTLHDPTLVRSVPLRALLDAAHADDAIVRALEAKDNPRIAQIRSEVRSEVRSEGLIRAIESACRLLAIGIDPPRRQQLEALDSTKLENLLTHLETERGWP